MEVKQIYRLSATSLNIKQRKKQYNYLLKTCISDLVHKWSVIPVMYEDLFIISHISLHATLPVT